VARPLQPHQSEHGQQAAYVKAVRGGIEADVGGHGLTPTEDPDVLWNFEKFLIGKDGSVVGRFAPAVTPDDPALVAAIEAELSK
jgi:glutathione peroxidase